MNLELLGRYQSLMARVSQACARSARFQSEVTLLAVSKKQPVEMMQDYLEICREQKIVATFGENYVQEFKKKREILNPGYLAHMIGPLQSNKVRDAVALFDLIESVHTVEIAQHIDKAAAKMGKVQSIYLQVNVSSDDLKSGFPVDSVMKQLDQLSNLQNISIDGLMTITRLYDEPEQARPDFRKLRNLRDEAAQHLGRPLGLSMGMSSDFEIAVEQGATVVRVGTALFGERN